MKVLVINQFGNGQVKETNIIPRIGDSVDLFYEPMPIVKQVVLWPSPERLRSMHADTMNIEAIVVVS